MTYLRRTARSSLDKNRARMRLGSTQKKRGLWGRECRCLLILARHRGLYSWSAFHLSGKIGFRGRKSNGTGLSNENFSKKREYLQRYSSFLVFTGITGKSLYHLLYNTSAMLLGKNTRFRSRKWRPPSCFSVQHAVIILNQRNVIGKRRSNFTIWPLNVLVS